MSAATAWPNTASARPPACSRRAGAGACVISDAWEGIEQFFTPGREILVAADGAEVNDILTDLTSERAGAIGQAAQQRALAQHTYAARVDLVEAALEGVDA